MLVQAPHAQLATQAALPRDKSAFTVLPAGTLVELLDDPDADSVKKVKVCSTGQIGWMKSLENAEIMTVSAAQSTVAAIHRVNRYSERDRASSIEHVR